MCKSIWQLMCQVFWGHLWPLNVETERPISSSFPRPNLLFCKMAFFLMILLSYLIEIALLIFGSRLSGLLNLSMTLMTLDCGSDRFVCFNTGKTSFGLFDGSSNSGTVDVNVDGSDVYEKPHFKMLVFPIYSKLD